MKIAFAGTGLMGSRMASRLLQAGKPLTVYNKTDSKTELLVSQGAKKASSFSELAEDADILFTMLSDPLAVETSAIGEEGFLPALKEGAFWIDCSTVNPSFSQKMAAASEEMGVRFMDAPVTGSTLGAQNGELTFFIGGALNDLETVRPLLEIMGKRFIHAGAAGMGSAMKLINNHLGGTIMAAFSEALAFGESMGFSRKVLLDTFLDSTVAPPYLSTKREKFEQAKFDDTEFPLELMKKDLHLAGITGYEHNAALPMASAAKEIYALAIKAGLGTEDYAAVYKLLSGLSKRD
ncbi:MAG: NAD(P)-dependent oxidoreductase [Chitinispirillaceae bacterium]